MCYGASVLLLPPRSSPVSALLREFTGSDKRWRENTRQPVCETGVSDSFPHFIHMLWLIQTSGCSHKHKSLSFKAGASEHAFYMMHYSIRCETLSNLRWVALMMNRNFMSNSLPGMEALNRSVINLILSLELHPMSMSCREPATESFLPRRELRDVLYRLLPRCYRLKENILRDRDCWVFHQLWGE